MFPQDSVFLFILHLVIQPVFFLIFHMPGFPYSFIHIYEWLLPLVHIGRWHDLTYRQTSFYCISLYCSSQIPCFCGGFLFVFSYQVEDFWQPYIHQIHRCHFPNPICSGHVSVSHLGNSCSTYRFSIFLVCALLFCDL